MKSRTQLEGWPDIHPRSSTSGWVPLDAQSEESFSIEEVAPIVGLQPAFVRRVIGKTGRLSFANIDKLVLLDDSAETFVPRSKIAAYFQRLASRRGVEKLRPHSIGLNQVICGDAHKLIPSLDDQSIDCV